MPDDAKYSLLKYLLSEARDKVSVQKINEILAKPEVDVNLIVNNNTALLVALNRFLDKPVIQILMRKGADGNHRTAEGRLLFEFLFDDFNEVNQIKETIKCFKRGFNRSVTLSKESKEFAESRELKDLIRAESRSRS